MRCTPPTNEILSAKSKILERVRAAIPSRTPIASAAAKLISESKGVVKTLANRPNKEAPSGAAFKRKR